MPYIPDLIPENNKVIPEYFHQQSPVSAKVKQKVSAEQVISGLLFLLIAICFIRYTAFAAIFGLLALSCTKAGKRWLEKTGRFSLTGIARVTIYGFALLASVPLYLNYVHQDELDAAQRAAAHQRAVRFTADSLQKDNSRKEELYTLLHKASLLAPDSGLRLIVAVNRLVKTPVETDSVKVVATHLQLQLLQYSLAKRNFKVSLTYVKQLLNEDPRKPELWFYRARCYIGLDSIQLAVNDLDSARALNYKPASQLFEKINPLKRHIVGHCTLCADGSTSSATGRGACSWHGGVAEWDHPIYETSRKYGE